MMLEKLEIYPYQRVAESAARKKSKKKWDPRALFKKLKWNGRILPQASSISLKDMLSVENGLLALGVLIMARAFVLGELLPFVFAYIAAFGEKEKSRSIFLAFFAVLGFCTVLQGFELWSNILAVSIMAGIIYNIEIPSDKRLWGLPLLTISLVFVIKSLLLLSQGLSLYTEMIIVFEAMIAGVLSFVFINASDVINEKKALPNFAFEDIAAFLLLGIGVIMGLHDIEVAGLNLSSILCRLGILIAAFLWGSGGGTMVGVMSGIIPSISSSIFAQSLGMYALSGLLAGLFKNFGRLGVIIGFMLGNLAISLFLPEKQASILGIWETGIASLIFFFIPDSLKEKVPVQTLGPVHSLPGKELQHIDSRMQEAACNHIENIAGVFEELGSTLVDDSSIKRKKQETAYLNYLYDEISHEFCERCSRYEICWNRECYNTSQEMLDIFTLVETEGELSYDNCPAEFKRRCIYARELLNAVNKLFERLQLNEYWSGKFDESRKLVATQLKEVSRVIKDLAKEMKIQSTVDMQLREQILKRCKKMEINIKDCTPIRNGEQLLIKVLANSCHNARECEVQIAAAISSLLGEKMEVSQKKCPRFWGRGECEFTLNRAFAYRVVSGAAQVGKEEVSGDSFTIATLKEGKELIALSDGMGVGEKANCESQAAVRLLENLLNSGFDKEVALNTINSVLQLRSTSESFATLDMIMIDLYTAEVNFIKIASAPSFIKRGKRVGIVRSNSLPIGILENVDIVSEKRALFPRDIIVMASDGLLEVSREMDGEEWIKDFLTAVDETDPQRLAEMIMNKALAICGGKPADDMTVICMYIDLN